jgi:Ca-activated chloride channel family protein
MGLASGTGTVLRRAGWIAAAAVSLAALGGEALSGQTFRTMVDLASFGVTVVDRKGGLVTDLVAADFAITEDSKSQQIKLFARGDDKASDGHASPTPEFHLGLLFDTSGSMEEDIRFSRSAAVKFLNALAQAVDITLVDFDTEVRVARYGQNDFARLIERIRNRKADGWTALYDAMGVYLDGAASQEGRRVLVIYTDGDDTNSTMSYMETLNLLKASDVTVYVVAFLEHQSRSAQPELRMRLHEIAELTGGEVFFPLSMKDLDAAYDKVLAEIKAQYTLGYVSSNARADGTWRKVQVTVTRPGLKVRTRRGYFAPFRKTP